MDLVHELAQRFDVSPQRIEGALGVVFRALRDQAPVDLGNDLIDAVPEAPGWIARADAPPPDVPSQTGLLMGNRGAETMRLGGPVGVAAGLGGGGGTHGDLQRFGFDPEAAGHLVPPVFRFLRGRLGPEKAERLSFSVPFLRRLGNLDR